MSTLPAIPSISEELERKTLTECERLVHQLSTRQIGLVEFKASMTTLWCVVSGLVSKESMDLITQVLKQPIVGSDGSGRVVAMLRSPSGQVLIAWYVLGKAVLHTSDLTATRATSFESRAQPFAELRAAFDKLVTRLTSAGYTDILKT